MPSALDGLRVLDLSTLFSAPQISALLGDWGADVVKLELPAGDPQRRIGVQRDGRSLMWSMVGEQTTSLTKSSLPHQILTPAERLEKDPRRNSRSTPPPMLQPAATWL